MLRFFAKRLRAINVSTGMIKTSTIELVQGIKRRNLYENTKAILLGSFLSARNFGRVFGVDSMFFSYGRNHRHTLEKRLYRLFDGDAYKCCLHNITYNLIRKFIYALYLISYTDMAMAE